MKRTARNGAIEGEVTELIQVIFKKKILPEVTNCFQGKKLKPLTKWSGYGEAFQLCVVQKFGMQISEEDFLSVVDLVDPASVEIWNVRNKFIQLKEFVVRQFSD